MTKDADGVWSVTIDSKNAEVFKYCFVMDGTRVADPNDMYLSPDKGFKYSVCNNPYNAYSLTTMGNISHGRVAYDLNRMIGCYLPDTDWKNIKNVVLLRSGADDTIESWFKVGGADAIADKLIAEGKTAPCLILTGVNDAKDLQLGKNVKVHVLQATDYATWQERREALAGLLSKIK